MFNLGSTIAVDENLISHHIPDSFVMESHEPLKEDNVSWLNVGRIGQSLVLYERVLRNGNRFVGVLEFLQNIVSEVEVESKGVVEIVLGDVDFMLIYT